MPASTVSEPPPTLVVRATFGRKGPGSATWQGQTSCGGPLNGLTADAPTFPRVAAALAGKIWDVIQAGAAARSEDVHPDELSVLTVLAIQETLYRGSKTPALRIPADAARGRRGGWFLQVCDFAGPLGGIIGTGSTLVRARDELVAVIRAEISAGRVQGLPRDYAAPILVQHSQRRTYSAAVLSRLAAAA